MEDEKNEVMNSEIKTETETETKQEEKKVEKTFTQSELDAILEKRLKRERTAADEKASKAIEEINSLKNKNACYKLGIKDDFIDDALALANRYLDDKTDMSQALSKVLDRFPSLTGKDKTVQTGVKTEQTSEKNSNALRKAFGLK